MRRSTEAFEGIGCVLREMNNVHVYSCMEVAARSQIGPMCSTHDRDRISYGTACHRLGHQWGMVRRSIHLLRPGSSRSKITGKRPNHMKYLIPSK